MSSDYRMMCPNCYNETRYIVQHMSKSKCQKNEYLNEFKEQFKAYKADHIQYLQREINKKSNANQRMQNEEKVKLSQNKRKRESMAHQRASDEAKFKEVQNKLNNRPRKVLGFLTPIEYTKKYYNEIKN